MKNILFLTIQNCKDYETRAETSIKGLLEENEQLCKQLEFYKKQLDGCYASIQSKQKELDALRTSFYSQNNYGFNPHGLYPHPV